MRSTPLRLTLLFAVSFGLATAVQAQGVAGHVHSIQGDVTAQGPDGAARGLGCGDPVFAGDTLVTESGSRVGVLMGEALAKLAPKSTLHVGLTDAQTPDARLEQGRVRIIDVRDGAAPGRLTAGDAASQIAGNDAEAYVFDEKAGRYAMFCEWDEPLSVARGDEELVANSGECVIAKPDEPLYKASGHDDRIAASGAGACSPDVRSFTSARPHFPPDALPDVAAGPPPPHWNGLPGPLAPVGINPCDNPGAVCAGNAPAGAGGSIIVSEPPPISIPKPGGVGVFPGTP